MSIHRSDLTACLSSMCIGTRGKHRDDIPHVVLVQPSLYDSYRRRVVVPLVNKAVLGEISNLRFNPSFRIEKNQVVLHPLEIVSIPNEHLGEYVASLDHEGGRNKDALDELLTQACGLRYFCRFRPTIGIRTTIAMREPTVGVPRVGDLQCLHGNATQSATLAIRPCLRNHVANLLLVPC